MVAALPKTTICIPVRPSTRDFPIAARAKLMAMTFAQALLPIRIMSQILTESKKLAAEFVA